MNNHTNKKNCVPLLKVLKTLKGPDLKEILLHLDDTSTNVICECVYNVLHTDLKLSSQKKNGLKKFIKSKCSIHRLKKISTKNVPISKRRKYLSQEGTGLPLLLGTAIPFLIDLIFGKK